MIEEELRLEGYDDVYNLSEYRERRAQSRQMFFDQSNINS